MRTPNSVKSLWLEATCVNLTPNQYETWMAGYTRTSSRLINRLVHKYLSNLWEALTLNLWNPYHYHKTARHLILVHSGIEYFLAYRL